MFRALLPASTLLCVILLPLAGHADQLDELISPNLELPSSDTTFPDGPGADAMNSNCLACHSADHMLNQPTLPRNVWEEVVDKMINVYKAPITPQDAATIVDYLAREPGEDKREADSRPGMGGGGISRQNEDASTDDAADTKRDKACK